MDIKIKSFFLFIILVLLQSCSGGRIGNFFESSFKNIEETKIKEDVKNNLKNKVLKMSEKKSKNNKKISDKNIFLQNKAYQPKSYKIIFILKDVDPKDPIEDLSTILRDSDVNFEIEKIERFFESNNKNLKTN